MAGGKFRRPGRVVSNTRVPAPEPPSRRRLQSRTPINDNGRRGSSGSRVGCVVRATSLLRWSSGSMKPPTRDPIAWIHRVLFCLVGLAGCDGSPSARPARSHPATSEAVAPRAEASTITNEARADRVDEIARLLAEEELILA